MKQQDTHTQMDYDMTQTYNAFQSNITHTIVMGGATEGVGGSGTRGHPDN